MNNSLFKAACWLLAAGIILGAFAAHGLKEKISGYHLDIFEKGVKYHLIHAIGLLVLAMNASYFKEKAFKIAAGLMLAGIVCFSGSLYLLSTLELLDAVSLRKVLGPITPVGGLCFIGSWVLLSFSVKKRD